MMKYTYSRTGERRKHFVSGDDIDVVLRRIPEELWMRLREVHFNDRSRGARVLGYVNRGRREIAICALPPNVSLARACARCRRSPSWFGAARRRHWSETAIRRFMLYEVFLHELGHLQIVNPQAKNVRRKFAMERKAEEFAECWRRRLWAQQFDHPDPVHNPPTSKELQLLDV